MNKVDTLLSELKNIPAAILNRNNTFKSTLVKLHEAKTNFEADPSDENQQKMDELNQKAIDQEEGLVSRIEALIKKQNEEQTPASPPEIKPEPKKTDKTPSISETKKPEKPEEITPKPKEETPKKKSKLPLIIGGLAVLALTAGAVNLFKQK